MDTNTPKTHRQIIGELLSLSHDALRSIGQEGIIKWHDVASAYALGAEVDYKAEDDHVWHSDEDPEFVIGCQYRIKPAKPRTVFINGVEIVAPEVNTPPLHSKYYTLYPQEVVECTWDNIEFDHIRLKNGRIWLTKEHAKAAYDAITGALTGANTEADHTPDFAHDSGNWMDIASLKSLGYSSDPHTMDNDEIKAKVYFNFKSKKVAYKFYHDVQGLIRVGKLGDAA